MTHINDEQMMSYIDSELPEEQTAAVREHLAECQECRDKCATHAKFSDSVTQTGRFVFNKKPMTQQESDCYHTDVKKRMQAPKWRLAGGVFLLIAILVGLNAVGKPLVLAIAGGTFVAAIFSFLMSAKCCCTHHSKGN